MTSLDDFAAQSCRFLRAVRKSPLACRAQRQVHGCWNVPPRGGGEPLDFCPNLVHSPAGQNSSQTEVFAQNTKQQMFGIDPGRTKIASFLPRKENRAAGMLVITLKHQLGTRSDVISALSRNHRSAIALTPRTPATASITRSTSWSEVCQLQTLTRMARRPRQVVPPKTASPVAQIASITSSVRRS